MKKIKLTQYTTPQKSNYIKSNFYTVYLGNDRIENFSNLKDCKKYLVVASKFLNYNMLQINLLLIELYAAYRSNYFLFNSKQGLNSRALESDILQHIDRAENFLNLSWQKSGLTNGYLYAFDFQFKSLVSIRSAFEGLQRFVRSKNLMYEFNKLEVLRQKSIYIYRCLELYPAENMDKLENIEPVF